LEEWKQQGGGNGKREMANAKSSFAKAFSFALRATEDATGDTGMSGEGKGGKAGRCGMKLL